MATELGYTSRGTASNVVAKALKEQTAEAVGGLRGLENARLDALQVALWDAAMTGDVQAVSAILRIVAARVRLNGLEPARDGFGATPSTPRTAVVRKDRPSGEGEACVHRRGADGVATVFCSRSTAFP